MNINNIFGGILGLIMSMSLIYLFWSPINDFLEGIGASNTEIKIFLQVAFVAFCFIIGIISPLNLATSDDKGEQ